MPNRLHFHCQDCNMERNPAKDDRFSQWIKKLKEHLHHNELFGYRFLMASEAFQKSVKITQEVVVSRERFLERAIMMAKISAMVSETTRNQERPQLNPQHQQILKCVNRNFDQVNHNMGTSKQLLDGAL